MVQRAVLVFSLVMMVGCGIPMNRKQINIDLFKNEADFTVKAQYLEKAQGKPQAEIIKFLGVPAERIEKVLPVAVETLVHPNAIFQPHTASEYREYERLTSRFEGYSIAYKDVDETMDLPLYKFRVDRYREGFEHKLFLVFERETHVLHRAYVAFVPVHEHDRVYIWQIATDFASGSVSQGGKETVKALGF